MLKRLFPSRQSIQVKLAAIVLGVSLIFSVVSLFSQLGINHANTVIWTTESLEKQIAGVSHNLSESLLHGDEQALLSQLDSLTFIPYVINVHLIAKNGEQYWAKSEEMDYKGERLLSKNLTHKGKVIGTLIVFFDCDSVTNLASINAIPTILIQLVETLTVAILLLVIFRRAFTNRVELLVQNIDRIDLNRVNRFAIPDSLIKQKDELGRVARSIQELYHRVRSDMVQNKLRERTLKQHKSLLTEEINLRAVELEWQSRANKLLVDLSLKLLKGQKTNVEHAVRMSLPTLAELFESEHIFWLSLENDQVRYRAFYPLSSQRPAIDIHDNYTAKRWLLEAKEVVTADISRTNNSVVADNDFLDSIGVHSLAMFPLTDGKTSFGVVVVSNNHHSLQWNENKSLLLKRVATMLSELTVRERDQLAMIDLQEELILANEKLRLEADTDELTRLPNRRPFNRTLSSVLFDASESQTSVAIMMIDIDHFKAYNDIYGHLHGDKVLTYVARAMETVANSYHASLARVGGEEFALLLHQSDFESAQRVAWELCQTVRDLCIPHQGSTSSGIITISIGGVIGTPCPDTHPAQLLEWADQCLYRAKRAGRNRAVLSQDDCMERNEMLEAEVVSFMG